MRKILTLFVFLISFPTFSQTDYSDRWEDFFSYTNVKDFVKVDNVIYALADNAVFTYNTQTQETTKLSSVKGLSGETTSAIHYSKEYKRLIIGYETGLVEVVDKDGRITVSPDIVNFNQAGSKRINDIYEHNNILYLSTPFAVVAYNIERVEFGDTYFIAPGSSEINVNQTTVFNDTIYAATANGIFSADVNNPNLIDFNSWQQQFIGRNFKNISTFNNKLYAVIGRDLFEVDGMNLLPIRNFTTDINNLFTTDTHLTVSLENTAIIFNTFLNEVVQINSTTDFNFTLNTAFADANNFYLGTKKYGILTSSLSSVQNFQEIHPDGPLNNAPFYIAVKDDNLWVVYGKYDDTYTPLRTKSGYSHYMSGEWKNSRFNPDFPITDLNYISINPNDNQHVYISSMGVTLNTSSVATGGILEIKNDEIVNFYNQNNSSLQDILATNPNVVTIRVVGTIFDKNGNFWITNIGVNNRIKKLTSSGNWFGFDIDDIRTSGAFGMGEIALDKTNSLWITTRQNGVYVFNENGERKRALTTTQTQGNLPNTTTKTIAVDDSNKVWIGTRNGLVVYNNANNIFDAETYDAEPIIIIDDGTPRRLLGEQSVTTIVVDGADNKWFGTENGGVVYTNPSGQTTLATFNKSNSPLPSNKIIKIAVDNSTGKVYFATDKGIVVYNSNVSPFGNELGEVYAYPNPALNNHETITINGRNNTHLPRGTNVKILDASGNLVYETNVIEGQELQGGKVVWNKRNLAGNKVASGVYIVLLSNDDASKTTTTKIAIVN